MFTIRKATLADKPALNALIASSGVALSAGFYTTEQAQAITREVYGVDSALVQDGTFYAIESEGAIVACGAWSQRTTECGGDHAKSGDDSRVDPATGPARIRAFFVDPSMARKGLGSMMLEQCTQQARLAGFTTLELVATLPGEPLYLRHGFSVLERFVMPLSGGVRVPLTRMRKEIV